MKDEIMTLSEYQALVKEYNESDSVCQRESIADTVYNEARALMHKLIALYSKYGKDFVGDSNYKEYCGCLFLVKFDESTAWMKWSDPWTSCEIGIQMKYLDNGVMKVLEKELSEEHATRIEKLIREKRHALEQLKKVANDLEKEIGELESGKFPRTKSVTTCK